MSLKQAFSWLRSLKFTIALLALLIVLSAIATFSPHPEAFFGTLGFFALAFLFFVNLSCCTAYRFAKELKKSSNRNFGPDILHGGLILFMIFALLSTYSRMEGQIGLAVGESVDMPGGNVLTLDDFEYQQYENGRPRDWISYLTVRKGDAVIVSRYALRVNHPLELDGLTFYQISYGEMGGKEISVIQAVREPLWGLVLAAFIVFGAGTFATLFVAIKKIIRKKDLKE
jgi:cytochrome c biogenesis protein